MATFTLDDIRTAAEAKYGATEIEVGNHVVRLLNPLRLTKAKRDELGTIQSELEADDADHEELMAKTVRIVAETETQADILLDAVGDDLALLAEIVNTYGEGTQAGEA